MSDNIRWDSACGVKHKGEGKRNKTKTGEK